MQAKHGIELIHHLKKLQRTMQDELFIELDFNILLLQISKVIPILNLRNILQIFSIL